MLRNVEKRGVQAARNGPSEDSKCWQRARLGIHGLNRWDRDWSRKVRETRSSSSHQCSKKNRCRSLRFSIPTISPASHSLATGHDLPAAYRSAGNWPGRPGWLPTQTPHRSGRVEQETHLVTPPRPTSQVPIIGFSALLQLVEWYQVRLRRDQQGGSSCVDPQPPLSPPAPAQGSPSPQSAPALAQLDRRIPRANPGHLQSRRGPAARSASSHPGGDQ